MSTMVDITLRVMNRDITLPEKKPVSASVTAFSSRGA
jgi:hypothetical protein